MQAYAFNTYCKSILACHASITGLLQLFTMHSLGLCLSSTTLPLLDTSKAAYLSNVISAYTRTSSKFL